jgi:predicted CXXCH cytochrome family protein
VKVEMAALAGMRLLPISLGDTRGHPQANHPVADGGSLACLSCHNPHAADGSERRFVTETRTSSQLCIQCHK